jgi:son of sevenless
VPFSKDEFRPLTYALHCSVLNTFKTMIQDEDILEKEDMYILGRMSEFLKKKEVNQLPAAKGLLTLIERSVCTSISRVPPF